MTDQTYEGWTNHETWTVNLWINNEQGEYAHWTNRTRSIYDETLRHAEEGDRIGPKKRAWFNLADELKETYETNGDAIIASRLDGHCVWGDLLTSALQAVNWDEIARAMVEEHITQLEATT